MPWTDDQKAQRIFASGHPEGQRLCRTGERVGAQASNGILTRIEPDSFLSEGVALKLKWGCSELCQLLLYKFEIRLKFSAYLRESHSGGRVEGS